MIVVRLFLHHIPYFCFDPSRYWTKVHFFAWGKWCSFFCCLFADFLCMYGHRCPCFSRCRLAGNKYIPRSTHVTLNPHGFWSAGQMYPPRTVVLTRKVNQVVFDERICMFLVFSKFAASYLNFKFACYLFFSKFPSNGESACDSASGV